MAHWYFEDIEVGASRKAGPYLVSKNEIVQFASNTIRCPATSTRMLRWVQFLEDCRHRAPTRSRSSSC
jgi:hypothetical protein